MSYVERLVKNRRLALNRLNVSMVPVSETGSITSHMNDECVPL